MKSKIVCLVYRCAAAVLFMVMPFMIKAYTISGRMVEKETGEACLGVSYNVYLLPDTVKPILSGMTGEGGRFNFSVRKSGEYCLTTSAAGYSPLRHIFEVKSNTDLGVLTLSAAAKELDEVVVVSRRDLIRSDGAKLTYDMEKDPDSGAKTVLEMLRRVPMVSVDGEDNIKVKGQSNFKIYVNGKPDPMLSSDPKSILKAMPASSIKRIEVITDPGAKYEAEGTGGILNIITVTKQRTEGYSGNVRAGMSNRGYNGSVYLRGKYRNVTAAVSANGNNRRVMQPHTYGNYERENLTSDKNRFYRIRARQNNKYSYTGAGLDLSWEPDTLNLFTFTARYSHSYDASVSDQTLSMWSVDNEPQWSYNSRILTHQDRRGLTSSLSYQHTFPNNTLHFLALTYQFDYNWAPRESNTSSSDYINFPGTEDPFNRHLTNSYMGHHTLQIDYSLPLFADRHTLETGAKAVIRSNRMNESTALSDNGEVFNRSHYIGLTQHNDVYAAYLSYSATFGHFSTRAGVRYEHTRLGIDYKKLEDVADYKDFSNRLNDWVPNASLTYNITDASNLRVAYSIRIRRPSVSQLNPFVNDLTYGYLDYGNPNLTSEKLHNVELKYSNYGGKVSGEFSLDYYQSDNSINEFQFMQDGVLHTTYANTGKYRSFSLGAYGEFRPNDKLGGSIWVGTSYENYKAKSLGNLSNHGWQTNVNLNFDYTLPCKLRFDLYGGLWTPWISLQDKADKTGYYYGLNMSRGFLKDDKLRLSLGLSTLLPVNQTYAYTTTAPNSRIKQSGYYKQWWLSVSVTYKFGSLKSNVKQTHVKLDNNDISTGGGNKGGRN